VLGQAIDLVDDDARRGVLGLVGEAAADEGRGVGGVHAGLVGMGVGQSAISIQAIPRIGYQRGVPVWG
jgi:hypothetical protein